MQPQDGHHDPDQLLHAWRTLCQHQERLHQPQAAALLGVPEARLVATLVGHGATCLQGDPQDILTAIADFGKLLMAVPHHAGALIGIGQPEHHSPQPGISVLSDAYSRLEVTTDAIASLYVLVEEQGPHGRQRHLQAFNAQGHALFKLLVLYKRHAADLQALARRFRAPRQTRSPELSSTDTAIQPTARSDALLQACLTDLQQWSAAATPLRIACSIAHTTLCVTACQPRIQGISDGFLHFRHPNMKLHTRLAQMGNIQKRDDQWCCHQGTSSLSFARLCN